MWKIVWSTGNGVENRYHKPILMKRKIDNYIVLQVININVQLSSYMENDMVLQKHIWFDKGHETRDDSSDELLLKCNHENI